MRRLLHSVKGIRTPISLDDVTILRCYMAAYNTYYRRWTYYEDASVTLRVPVSANTTYCLYWDETDPDIVGALFRVGAVITDNIPVSGTVVQSYKANGTSTYNGYIVDRGQTPATTPSVTFTTGNNVKYIYIQITGDINYWNNGDTTKIKKIIAHLYLINQ